MYIVARISSNGVLSQSFAVQNGVKQGGIVSPVLFCVLGLYRWPVDAVM